MNALKRSNNKTAQRIIISKNSSAHRFWLPRSQLVFSHNNKRSEAKENTQEQRVWTRSKIQRNFFFLKVDLVPPQRRNSAFFLDEKKQSIFFLKMLDTNLMNKYQKKKKNRSLGEIEIFAHFSDFFVFKNGDFTYTGTFYSLIRSRMVFLRALLF